MFCIGSIKKLSQISRELYRSEEHKLRIKSSKSITEIDVEKVIFWGSIMSITQNIPKVLRIREPWGPADMFKQTLPISKKQTAQITEISG